MSLESMEFTAEMPSGEWAVTANSKPWISGDDLIDHDLKQMREMIRQMNRQMNRETKVRLWRSNIKKGKYR